MLICNNNITFNFLLLILSCDGQKMERKSDVLILMLMNGGHRQKFIPGTRMLRPIEL